MLYVDGESNYRTPTDAMKPLRLLSVHARRLENIEVSVRFAHDFAPQAKRVALDKIDMELIKTFSMMSQERSQTIGQQVKYHDAGSLGETGVERSNARPIPTQQGAQKCAYSHTFWHYSDRQAHRSVVSQGCDHMEHDLRLE